MIKEHEFNIEEKFKEAIINNNLIQTGDNIIVGVSGGPDSICLLNLLFTLKDFFSNEKNIKYNLYVAHVNHLIREEADEDRLYVEKFCEQRNLPFYFKEVDVSKLSKENHMSEEAFGRKSRYDFFNELCDKLNANKIAVAHNLDDNVETILLNMFRGCGLKGLTGMDYRYENIIRPLIDIEKKDILDYTKEKKLNPKFDKTNEMDIYKRNKIRLNLIPEIKNSYNPNILESITRMKHILELDENFLDEYTKKVLNVSIIDNNKNRLKFNFENILNEHDSIKKRCIRKLVEIKTNSTEGLENVHVAEILKLFKNNIKGKKYILGNKFTIEIINKYIAIIY